jgi:predicted Holliday junction resolvase-like endonuclease
LPQEENEKEDKPKNYSVKIVDGIALADTGSLSSISTISGSIKQSFETLRGTFDTNQKFIADYLHIEQKLECLPKIAESMEKTVKLAEEQRDEAIKEARRDRNRFYVGVVIGAVGIVVAAIIGIIALLR